MENANIDILISHSLFNADEKKFNTVVMND